MEDLTAESKALARDVYLGHGVEGLALFLSSLVSAALRGQPNSAAQLGELSRTVWRHWVFGELDCDLCGKVHPINEACP